MAVKTTRGFNKTSVRTRGTASRRKKLDQRSDKPASFLTYSPQGLVIKTASGSKVKLNVDPASSLGWLKTPATKGYLANLVKKQKARAAQRQRTAASDTKNTTQENPILDLSNITIINSAQPSRESEIIHQFYTLRKYREFGKKKEDFAAAYERELIDRYEQLSKEKQDSAYEILEKEFYAL